MGRTTLVRRVVEHPADFLYTYNLDGSVKSLQFPSGRVVNYAYDTAGHALSATDSNGTQYVSSASYAPTGAVTAYLSGASAGFGGISQSFLYNPRLQLCRITAWTTGSVPPSCNDAADHGNLIDRSYNFGFGAGNNGNVLGISDYRDSSRSQSFAYDNLNRLTSAQNAGTDCSEVLPDGHTKYWGNSYAYDAWGNLINKTITKCGAEHLEAQALANNQLADYGYDAAGSSITYWYDNDGQRYIKWNNGVPVKSYFYGAGGEILAEGSGGSVLTAEYIFFNGKRIARADQPGSTAHYYLSDHLGSTSMVVSSTGVPEEESDYSPFGTEYVVSGPGSNRYKFTGKERDSETGLDLMGVRYYSSAMGRFMTTDPLAGHPQDPQTLNKYSYVRNNPLRYTDPTGMDLWLQGCGKNSSTCQNNFAGTTDKDGNFTRTHITGDQTGNATLGEHGITVTQDGKQYQGVWDTNKGEGGAVTVTGTGALKGYDAKVTGDCGHTCVAQGTVFNASNPNASPAALFSVLNTKDSGFVKNAGTDAMDFFHKGDINFRGHSDSDPHGIESTHIPINPKASTPHIDFHVDKVFPYDDVVDWVDHAGSALHTLFNQVTGAGKDPQ